MMKHATVKSRPGRRGWLIAAGIILAVLLLFFAYTADYYRADDSALPALRSDDTVTVELTDYGFFFDGPSNDHALIFYPGGKVEETAYAPLLRRLAADGMDVCLVKMPFHLAVFGMDLADKVMAQHSCQNWYIGGHSLGGAIAAYYAASNGDALRGLVLLAAYPTKQIGDELSLLSIYGTEDGVLQMDQYEKGKDYWPKDAREVIIEGGNHAQFGNYGLQAGDGTARLTAAEQQMQTTSKILEYFDIEAEKAAA